MFKYLFAKNDDIPAGSAAVYFGFSSIVWFVIGTGLGAFNAAKLAFPDFVHGLEFVSFGHMRQVHVHAVIFGWISMAFAMAMMYITPALGNTKMWSEKLGLWNCFLWNVGLVARPHGAVGRHDLGARVLRLSVVDRPVYFRFHGDTARPQRLDDDHPSPNPGHLHDQLVLCAPRRSC